MGCWAGGIISGPCGPPVLPLPTSLREVKPPPPRGGGQCEKYHTCLWEEKKIRAGPAHLCTLSRSRDVWVHHGSESGSVRVCQQR